MDSLSDQADVKSISAEIDAEIRSLPKYNTPAERALLRKYSVMFKEKSPGFILKLARELVRNYHYRSLPYELIERHKAAYRSLRAEKLVELGQGINSWWSVDSFARTLAGPAWRDGQVFDELIHSWARSPDRWWRRAALVSTVALNVRSRGGYGDVPRTLAVCRQLAHDHDDMVIKALSWALRELVPHDPRAVQDFLNEYNHTLPPRVKREVRNKLTTGLKNPRPHGGIGG